MNIPYLRSEGRGGRSGKSGFNPGDHSGKALINVLESYPRDELFQIDAAERCCKHAQAILALDERPRVRALVRVDQFDRFVSVIVFVPRDRYDRRRPREHRPLSEDRFRRPAVGLLSGLPRRRAGARALHHRTLRRQDAEVGGCRGSRRPPATSSAPGRGLRRGRERWPAPTPAPFAIAARLPESHRGPSRPAEALTDSRRCN